MNMYICTDSMGHVFSALSRSTAKVCRLSRPLIRVDSILDSLRGGALRRSSASSTSHLCYQRMRSGWRVLWELRPIYQGGSALGGIVHAICRVIQDGQDEMTTLDQLQSSPVR